MSGSGASPISVDWSYFMAERDRQVRDGGSAAYLLAPEISRLLDVASDPGQEFLLATLWYTGAKVGEVLSLVAADMTLSKEGGTVKLGKQGRCVPIAQDRYQSIVERRLESVSTARLLPISRQTASVWLAQRIAVLQEQGGFVDFPITAGTFRTSFAFHALLHAVPLETVQRWLGHRQADMTRRFMALFDQRDEELMRRMHAGG